MHNDQYCGGPIEVATPETIDRNSQYNIGLSEIENVLEPGSSPNK